MYKIQDLIDKQTILAAITKFSDAFHACAALSDNFGNMLYDNELREKLDCFDESRFQSVIVETIKSIKKDQTYSLKLFDDKFIACRRLKTGNMSVGHLAVSGQIEKFASSDNIKSSTEFFASSLEEILYEKLKNKRLEEKIAQLKGEKGEAAGKFEEFSGETGDRLEKTARALRSGGDFELDSQLYRHLIEIMNEGVVIVDKNGHIKYGNPKLREMFGMSMEDMYNRSPTDFLDEAHLPKFIEQFSGRKSGVAQNYEMQWTRLDGSVFQTLISPKPIFDEEGAFHGSVAVLTDITELNRARKECEIRETNYERLIDAMNEGFATTDANRYITFVNAKVCEMLGRRREELIGKNVVDLLDDSDERAYKRSLDNLSGKQEKPYELIMKRKDGRKIAGIVSPRAVFDEDGNPTEYVTTIQDITAQRVAEEKLRKSELMYRTLINTMPDGILIANLEGEISFASDKALQIAGLDNSDILIGRHVSEFVSEESKSQIKEKIRLTLQEGRSVGLFDISALKQNGEKIHIQSNSDVIRDERGEPASMIFVVRDVSVYKRDQEELEKYRLIASVASEMMILIDREHRYAAVNESFLRAFGLKRDEVVGKKVEKLMGKNYFESTLKKNYDRCFAGEEIHFEEWFDYPEYGPRCMSMVYRAASGKSGEAAYAVVVAKDITRIKKIEEELTKRNRELSEYVEELRATQENLIETQRELEKFYALVENSLDMISISDADGNILYMNPTGIRMNGLEDVDYRINLYEDPHVPDSFKRFIRNKVTPVVQERGFWNGIVIHKNMRTETKIECDATIFQIKDNFSGEPRFIGTIQRDVTEQRAQAHLLRKTNEELQTALDKLKATQTRLVESEKMATLGQLTAGIAHEINNPINFVSSNIAPLKRDLADLKELLDIYINIDEKDFQADLKRARQYFEEIEANYLFEEIAELLRGIEEGALRTKDIVRSLRNFSRIDESEFKYADVAAGIDSTLLLLKNQLKRRISIKKDFAKAQKIECQPGKLNQVFMNILTNAAQAIEGEGEIRIKTAIEGEYMRIEISDDGPGMPEDVRKKVFEPFFTTKDAGKGTGLGLSISRGIIEAHDGFIEVESKPGEGTTFIIRIPVNRN